MYVCARTTSSFEFSVAEAQADSVGLSVAGEDMKAYQGSGAKWVNNGVFLQTKQTSHRSQTDNLRCHVGDGRSPFAPHTSGTGA